MKIIKSFYLNNFFFYLLLGIIGLFVCAFIFPNLYNAVWFVVLVLVTFLGIDILLLYLTQTGIEAERITPEKLSNGDLNPVKIDIKNRYTFKISVKIIDEIPFQFQVRDFKIVKTIKASEQKEIGYDLRPTERGEYYFGALNIYVSSPLKLISRRFSFDKDQMVPTYPSYIQLRKYDLLAFSNRLNPSKGICMTRHLSIAI